MIIIASYIRYENNLISLDQCSAPLPYCLPDNLYIEGAMTLSIDNEEFISLSMWDYIDELWLDFLEAALLLKKEGRFAFSFPDQAIRVTGVEMDAGHFQFEIRANSVKAAILQKDVFCQVLLAGAREFCQHLCRLSPQHDILDLLRERLGELEMETPDS